MKHFLLITSLALALAAAVSAEDGASTRAGDIMIHDGWARASIGKAPNSAAYMTLMTEGGVADRLIAASTPAADRAELHNHILEDGIAKMRSVDAIDVAPGAATALEPGGLHIMLMGLKEKLDEGSELPLTLTFEKAGDVELRLPIHGLRHGKKKGSGHGHGS